MPRDYKVQLDDILESIKRIEAYVKGIDFDEFDSDLLKQDAIMKNLMVIGEAAKNIPEEIRAKIHGVDWKEVAGLRDVLIHQYFGIDLETIWKIIQEDLPVLKKIAQKLLNE